MGRLLLLLLFITIHTAHAQVISTVAGCGTCSTLGDGGAATSASLGYFAGIALDRYKNIYIADGNNNRVRKVDALTGVITTIVGNGNSAYNGENIPATAAQLKPGWLTFDTSENLLITDVANHRVRKIDATGIISTIAGNGVASFAGDGGPASNASLNAPQGIFCDNGNNLFIADGGNARVRKVSSEGVISTYAGNGIIGSAGDSGPATSAQLSGINAVCGDKFGNIFISDQDASRVRKVAGGTGVITTYAGTGIQGFNGDEIPSENAQLNWPWGIAIGADGNLYIADYLNQRIRMVDLLGKIHSVAGTGVAGYSGDGGAATLAMINRPEGVAFDYCGNMYIADFSNRRVRKVSFNPDCLPISVKDVKSSEAVSVTLHPNPATETLTITAGVEIEAVTIQNVIGQSFDVAHDDRLRTGGSGERQMPIDVSNLPPGVYMVRVNEVWTGKFIKE